MADLLDGVGKADGIGRGVVIGSEANVLKGLLAAPERRQQPLKLLR